MKLLNKLMNLNKPTKKKVIIFSIIFIILITFIIVSVYTYYNRNKNIDVPDVNDENIEIEFSETDVTCDNILILATPKLKEYNLYYYSYQVKEIEEIENEEQTEKGEDNRVENKVKNEVKNSVIDQVEKDNIENKEIEEFDITKIGNEEYTLYNNTIVVEENSIIYLKYELNGTYSENSYPIEITNIEKSGELSEEATEEELENEKVEKADTKAKYYIKVNVSANTVTVYGKDENGEYTKPIKAMVCSTGKATPKEGIYKTSDKYKWRLLFGNVYGQYATRIVGSILFHSVPYLKADNGTLEYWEYDKLGTSASMGCIRLTVSDSLWIYNNCEKGTQVEFYSSSNPGPLGKPAAQKITGSEFRDWDPTDPLDTNPWKTGVVQTNTEENTEVIDESENTAVDTNTVDNNTQNTINENTNTNKNEIENTNTVDNEKDNENKNEIGNTDNNENNNTDKNETESGNTNVNENEIDDSNSNQSVDNNNVNGSAEVNSNNVTENE